MVLLEGSPEGAARDEVCETLSTSASAALLVVAYGVPAAERLGRLPGPADLPPDLVVVAVGEADPTAAGDLGVPEERVTVHAVAAPTDLSRLGLLASKVLGRRPSGGTAICFDSVTALVRLTRDMDRVSRFIGLLGGQVRRMEAAAHFHLDPAEHGDEGLARLRPLFDEVVAVDGSDGCR